MFSGKMITIFTTDCSAEIIRYGKRLQYVRFKNNWQASGVFKNDKEAEGSQTALLRCLRTIFRAGNGAWFPKDVKNQTNGGTIL